MADWHGTCCVYAVGTKTTTTAEGATTVAVTAPPEAKAKAKEAAAAAAASPGGNARRCGSCGTSGAKARCGRCKSDWYCNASCQKVLPFVHALAACTSSPTCVRTSGCRFRRTPPVPTRRVCSRSEV